jgi:acid phosphatase
MRTLKFLPAIAALMGATALVQPASAFTLYDFRHIVVIYEENHSFDNLYGLWGNVNGQPVRGLPFADAGHTTQIRQDNVTPYTCLLQKDVNLTSPSPLPTTCVDNTGATFNSAFVNSPFRIDDYISPGDVTCPKPGAFFANGLPKNDPNALPGGCTRDIVHRYYNEQYQIHGGMQDRYVTGSDAAGLSMGYYDTTLLPIYAYLHGAGAPNYVIADNFFQGAFGGSFLNHQWLIAGKTPEFAGALNDASANDQHSVVDANGMPTNTPLYTSPLAAPLDRALTASCNPPAGRAATPANIVCGDYAINTIQPFSWPYTPNTADARRLPLLTHATIGDRLSGRNVDWAWYAGGWDNATGNTAGPGWTNGTGAPCTDPNANTSAPAGLCPDKNFQYHHQPFNYFANYAPGSPARAAHLLDEEAFRLAATTGHLKPVSFVKPIGEENEHPGYTNETAGSSHLVDLINDIVNGPQGNDTLIIVTYDEFGGSWDHVAPPHGNGPGLLSSPADIWGPGTRVPALIVSKRFTKSGVDHIGHDTTSILKTIELRYGLFPLGLRDLKVKGLESALLVAQ